ncbi:MAG TPA: tRNA (adenosine(37)-N6)-threonylcarbamoyltransferase complex dimerization subunit type 1 TsaB [Ramlibacter sp.]|nr:tRNA (adenosine(37)-N6)-threonylcarbamoyltransferase complex dimerization subunit type 1 TsaB [Ramlibacter sp.]
MNLLAFDTSTEALAIAVARGASVLGHEGPGGAAASASLLPTILELLRRSGLGVRDLDAIVFGRGPGSFTGLRTACSVAQGLALGGGVPVLPVETLLAVAEEARLRTGAVRVQAVLDARMREVYAAAYEHVDGRWCRDGDITLGAPGLLALRPGWTVAGNAGALLPAGSERVDALPTAGALLRLAPALLAAGHGRPAHEALPLYVRDKVAQTTDERAALRAGAAAGARMPP